MGLIKQKAIASLYSMGLERGDRFLFIKTRTLKGLALQTKPACAAS
ncbi:hypothetical protein [Laspinema olomoucense]|nr:hypothetical protein [Laspinema sp. D3b]